jgi:leader peptidase (prepilin peptidase)/N-methyltransferase
MEAVWIVVAAFLGMAIGSFLNVIIDRLPGGKSILFPASHCVSCQRHLVVKDLIPVFSYLWLRGRCRYCQAPIPKRILWVEIATGVLFAYLYWNFGLSAELAVAIFYCCLFLVLLVIDLEHGIIPNKLVYPSLVIALVLSIFLSQTGIVPGIKDAGIGFVIGLGLFLLIVLISRGGMGWGDVKMAALIGLVTGYPLVFVALFLAVVLGGLVAGILLLFKLRKRKEGIPFAPYLSLGAIITLLFGNYILNWYLGIIQFS